MNLNSKLRVGLRRDLRMTLELGSRTKLESPKTKRDQSLQEVGEVRKLESLLMNFTFMLFFFLSIMCLKKQTIYILFYKQKSPKERVELITMIKIQSSQSSVIYNVILLVCFIFGHLLFIK